MSMNHWFATAIFLFSLLAAPTGLAAEEQSAAGAVEAAQIDINTADAAAIAAALDGVGLVKAQEIVAYREMFGAFKTVDELMEVKGIGPGTLARNRDRIALESE
ncbi:MAG: helix-hairpin-helix domain-containing protein [Gammaproteobacteria bacterium]|nr:helix-hairpin-helix domain-containing protein [Gammaproteobacteria bacterium]